MVMQTNYISPNQWQIVQKYNFKDVIYNNIYNIYNNKTCMVSRNKSLTSVEGFYNRKIKRKLLKDNKERNVHRWKSQ